MDSVNIVTLGRRDVESQRRDVGMSRRRDVESQHCDVGTS